MKKIFTVIGARPQFIKAAPLSIVLRRRFTEILVHTGQHYDDVMSDQFFRDLGIPKPDYNLEVGSGGHGAQTARMLEKLELLMIQEKPDAVLVYGDTNSTLAAALAAVKLHIPIFHVESGLRSFNRAMPEEHNRILTDHMSDLLFCPTLTAVGNLQREGIGKGVHHVGDVMADSIRLYAEKGMVLTNVLNPDQLLWGLCDNLDEIVMSGAYYLTTVHRAESTDDHFMLQQIFTILGEVGAKVLLPAHPRLHGKLSKINIPANVIVIKPQGYLKMMALLGRCSGVLTDSGGLQKEAYLMKKPCITLRSETEWVETLQFGWNALLDPSSLNLEKLGALMERTPGEHISFYGDGYAAEQITDSIAEWFGRR